MSGEKERGRSEWGKERIVSGEIEMEREREGSLSGEREIEGLSEEIDK